MFNRGNFAPRIFQEVRYIACYCCVAVFSPCPECSSLVQDVLLFLLPTHGPGCPVSLTFWPSPSLRLDVASARSKRVQGRLSVVASLPFLFPYIGSNGAN